jgi:M6 family metalloprotease-like protein
MNKKYLVLLFLFLIINYIKAMPPKPGVILPQSDYDERSALGVDRFDNPVRNVGKKDITNTPGDVQLLLSGVKKFPVVCVKYPDFNNQYPVANFQAMIFSDTWSSGSARKFYQEVSYGKLNIQGTVYDWFTADSNRAYYGYSNGFARAARLAKEIAQKTDSLINYAQYDNDGDGYVDCFTCIHAGYGREESGNGADIWSHSWTFTLAGIGEYITNDPDPIHPGQYIKINGYVCDPERSNTSNNGTMVCIGVFCHEWGHAFGVPDLYDTNGGGEGLGNWCVMSGGSWGGNGNSPWKPAQMCAWVKMDLGWLNPSAVRIRNLYSIPQVESNSKAYWLLARQRTFKEYFLIENRRKTLFDTLLYNGGLLIYHIDDSVIASRRDSNKVNAGGTGWKYGVALEQADGYDHLYYGSNRGDAGDPFPGNYNNTNYDSITTNPNSKTNYPTTANLITSCFVKNIPASSPVMSCSLSSGIRGNFTGGPDAGGYQWIDSDTIGNPQYSWIDIQTSGTVLGNGDDARYSFTLPFNFNFYGTNYTTVWVSTNGWLSFGSDPGTSAPGNVAIPNSAVPNQAVFAFWDDLNLVSSDSANIYYQIFGTVPSRYCVITWKDARINGAILPGVLHTLNTITFQIILFENGIIVMQYQDCAVGDTVYNWGRSATVGIENNTGNIGLQYLYNGAPLGNLLSNERAVLFGTPSAIVESPIEQLTNANILSNNLPNPFKNQTIIQYTLPIESKVNLNIYNSAGILVRLLKSETEKSGVYRATWNGCDDKGKTVSQGVYFYQIKTENFKIIKKIIKIE